MATADTEVALERNPRKGRKRVRRMTGRRRQRIEARLLPPMYDQVSDLAGELGISLNATLEALIEVGLAGFDPSQLPDRYRGDGVDDVEEVA